MGHVDKRSITLSNELASVVDEAVAFEEIHRRVARQRELGEQRQLGSLVGRSERRPFDQLEIEGKVREPGGDLCQGEPHVESLPRRRPKARTAGRCYALGV